MIKQVSPRVMALALLAVAMPALAAAAMTPEAAIKARQANYKAIGGAFKAINDELKAASPSVAVIAPQAQKIAALAPGQVKLFPAGSGAASGIKTGAKAEIWTDAATFAKLNADLVIAANGLQAAAAKGDIAAITAARGNLGGACKACHEKFRERE